MEGVTVGETFPQLTEMLLEDLPMLTHVFGFRFRLTPILQNLRYLHVSECGNLIKQLPRLTHLYKKIHGLVQNPQKLCILRVSGCGNLEIVFTFSMAKTLVKLEELTMEDCDTRFKKSAKSGTTRP